MFSFFKLNTNKILILVSTIVPRFRTVNDIWDPEIRPDWEITNRFWIFMFIIWRMRTHQQRIINDNNSSNGKVSFIFHIMENRSNWTHNQMAVRKRLLKRERTNYSFHLIIQKNPFKKLVSIYLMTKKISEMEKKKNKKKGNCPMSKKQSKFRKLC